MSDFVLFSVGLLVGSLFALEAYATPASPEEGGDETSPTPQDIAPNSPSLDPQALRIEDVLACAARINPAIPIAEAERAAIIARGQRARLALIPRLRWEVIASPLPASQIVRNCVTGTYTDPRGNNYDEVLPCPNQEFQLLDDEQGLGFLAQSRLRLEQPLWTFGKVDAGRAAAAAGLDAWEAQVKQLRRELEIQAWESFLGIQLTRSIAKIIRYGNRKIATARRRIEEELERESGEYTRNDLRRLVIEQAELEARRLEVEALQRQAWGAVRIACRFSPDQPLALAEKKLTPLSEGLAPLESIVDRALREHPMLQAAQHRTRAQEQLLALAEAELWPNLAFVGFFNYSVGSAEQNTLANNPYNGPIFGGLLALQWRFDPGSFFSQRDGAAAKLERANADYQALRLQTRMTLLQRYEEARRYQQELSIRRQARRMGKQWFSSTFLNFSAGLTNSDDLTRSLNGYGRASINHDRALYEANVAFVKLANQAGVSVEELQIISRPEEVAAEGEAESEE